MARVIRPDEKYTAHNISYALQNVVLCWEMPLFAWMNYYSFPWTDFDDSRLSSRLTFIVAVRDAIGTKDIWYDAYSTFIAMPIDRSPAQNHLIDIWADSEEYEITERTPFRPNRGSIYSEDTKSLQFSDPSSEDEKDFEAGRRMIYGDFNFPVIHEDPRFAAPPNVINEQSIHVNEFNRRLQGFKKTTTKCFILLTYSF